MMTNVLASQTVQLYDRLRAAILSLDLAPGERLTERGLEASFDASRTPVRAALGRLDAEGLVQRDGRGWIVSPIDLAEIGALAELREAVEGAAVRLAVQRATDAEQGVRAGGDFHEQLTRLSGNSAMVDAVRGAMTRLARTRWLEVRTPAAREQAWLEHRAVLDALEARDADTASRLLTGHIRGTNDRLLAALAADSRRLRGHGLAILPDAPPGAPR